jgi:predicted PhzF superfamily epimerase YddE/YHI9/predicted GNAT family N-acyltransferase
VKESPFKISTLPEILFWLYSSIHHQNDDVTMDSSDSHHHTHDNNVVVPAIVQYRLCTANDIPVCYDIESSSYPMDEAASLSSLQYRQQNASSYFMCAVVGRSSMSNVDVDVDDGNHVISDSGTDTVIGFICSTRCHTFTHDSMSIHVPDGTLLAIHSVVMKETYRRRGIATQMLQQYIQMIQSINIKSRPKKIVLLAKSHLLSFYVNCGFQVLQPSSITHGKEQWYDVEMILSVNNDTTLSTTTATSRKGHTYYIVDAFATPNAIGTGNPAGVVLLPNDPNEDSTNVTKIYHWMQTVAQEFNISETAFVWKLKDSSNHIHYGIRYFTPTIEVDLCGHATLASAAVLCTYCNEQNVIFHTKQSIILNASCTTSSLNTTVVTNNESIVHELSSLTCNNNNNTTQISMTFPIASPIEIIVDMDKNNIISMIQNVFITIQEEDILYIGHVPDLDDLFIEVLYDAFILIDTNISNLNIRALLEWDGYQRGIIICCCIDNNKHTVQDEISTPINDSDINIDFYSRFFAPKAGIDEDPVTGSAHCALAPYYSKKLQKNILYGQQKSKRGGIVLCEIMNDQQNVKLTGTAITAATGTLLI